MARIWQSGFELNSTTANMEFTVVTNGTIQTSVVRGGTYAGRVTSLASGVRRGFGYQFGAAAGNGPFYIRVYIRTATRPSADNTIIKLSSTTGLAGTVQSSIKLSSTGTLKLFNGASQVGSDSGVLSLNTWYCVELKFDRTAGAGSQVMEARLAPDDNTTPVVFATASNLTIAAGVLYLSLGANLEAEAQTTGDWYFDDIAINNNTNPGNGEQMSYPSVGKIIHLRPNAAGDNAQWTAGSGSTFAEVDEVTPDDLTTNISTTTVNHISDFNIDATPAGMLSNDIINAALVGVRFTGEDTGSLQRMKIRYKPASGATVAESGIVDLSTVTWSTNTKAVPRNYPLAVYGLPSSPTTPLTKADLDTSQIGVNHTTADGLDNARVSALWLSVDHAPVAYTVVTKTHTTDIFIKKIDNIKTHTTDLYIKKLDITKTHTTDTAIKKLDNTVSHSTDVFIIGLGTVTKTHTTDTTIKKIDNIKTHTTDIATKFVLTKTHTTDVYLKKLDNTRTHTTDIKTVVWVNGQWSDTWDWDVSGPVLTHTTDILLKKTITVTHTTDILLKATVTRSHTTDLYIKKPTTVAHTTDTSLKAPLTRLHTTDVLLKKAIEKTHTTDLLAKKAQTVSHSTDIFLKKALIVAHTTDILIKKVQTLIHTTDIDTKGTVLKTHTTNILLKKAITVVHSTDVDTKGIVIKTFTTNILLKKAQTVIHTSDIYIKRTQTVSHSTDIYLARTQFVSHTTDILLKKAQIVNHTTDVDTKAPVLKAHTTDIVTKKTQIISHTADVYKIGAAQVIHTTDIYIKKTQTLSHNTDILLYKTQILSHTTNILLRKTVTASHTTDILTKKAQVLSHSTDIFLKITATRTHSTDILKYSTVTKTHATDILLKKIITLSHSTDIFIKRADTKSHSTDILLFSEAVRTHITDIQLYGTRSINHTTDIYIVVTRTVSHSTDILILRRSGGRKKIHLTKLNDSVIMKSTDKQIRLGKKSNVIALKKNGVKIKLWHN